MCFSNFHVVLQPLSCFVIGMDMIRHLVAGAEKKLCRSTLRDTRLVEKLSALKAQLKAMEVQSEFMQLIINRCLDYAKVSNGTSLTYNPETVDIRESLEKASLFASLVMDFNVEIVVDEIPESVCKFIITDSRWLQENILCLIEQARNNLKEMSTLQKTKVLTIRLSLEVDSVEDLDLSPLSVCMRSPITVHRQNVSSKQVFQLTPQRPTKDKAVGSPNGCGRALSQASRRWQGAPVQLEMSNNTIASTMHVDSLKSNGNISFASNVSLLGGHSNTTSIHTLGLHIELSTDKVSTSCDQMISNTFEDRVFQNGKSLEEMSFTNFQERLRLLRGRSGRKVTEEKICWFFCIPYRPDIARQNVRASFFATPDSSVAIALPIFASCHNTGLSLVLPESIAIEQHGIPFSECLSDQTLVTPSTQSAFIASSSKEECASANSNSVPVSARHIDVFFNPRYLSAIRRSVEPYTGLNSANTSPRFNVDLNERKLSPILSYQDVASPINHVLFFPKSTVFLVDDSNLVLKLTRSVLERSGYTVQTAHNGLEAVHFISDILTKAYAMLEDTSTIQNVKISLPTVLMDLQMPVLDGIEAVRRIRSIEKQLQDMCSFTTMNRLVICSLSANNDPVIIEEALEAGCDAFLQKPFNLEDFQQTIQQIHIFCA